MRFKPSLFLQPFAFNLGNLMLSAIEIQTLFDFLGVGCYTLVGVSPGTDYPSGLGYPSGTGDFHTRAL